MSVNAIEKHQNPQKVSYLNAAVTGALVSYALKWTIPLNKDEKDEGYKLNLVDAKHAYWQKRAEEIEAIRTTKEKLDGVDEFLKMSDKGNLTYAEIKKIPNPLQDNLLVLFNRVNAVGETAKNQCKKTFELNTKNIRPTSVFIVLGTMAGLLSALIYNSIAKTYAVTLEKDN